LNSKRKFKNTIGKSLNNRRKKQKSSWLESKNGSRKKRNLSKKRFNRRKKGKKKRLKSKMIYSIRREKHWRRRLTKKPYLLSKKSSKGLRFVLEISVKCSYMINNWVIKLNNRFKVSTKMAQ
jgi:hypothetical protein